MRERVRFIHEWEKGELSMAGLCRKYGVIQEKQTEDGARRECLVRSTFIIDKKGVIRHVAYGVNPRGHAAEVYDVVRRLRS